MMCDLWMLVLRLDRKIFDELKGIMKLKNKNTMWWTVI